MKLQDQVFQFKVTLEGIRPSVWRRIQIRGNSTFWDLHVAIQDAMGWFDCHLHEFIVWHPEWQEEYHIGIPDDDAFMSSSAEPGWKIKVADFLAPELAARYLYDFGDGWEHQVLFEEVLPKTPRARYPKCLDGSRACPPEDVGGIYGYQEFLESLRDPSHERHDEFLEWVGGSFDPEAFDATKIRFDNPKERLKMMIV